ncbi:MAG: hypothetical protein HQM04_01685 [Magnetococcales bacterium]|nr:hypothetical protein [Magnetococcales bacterium]MBF0113731.1 hypothetical protein [Magnetococcales bacterium]
MLGHSSASMTARYDHLASDPVRQAADRISGQIAASLDRKPAAEVVPIQQNRMRIRGG